jgi:hypothetical protein
MKTKIFGYTLIALIYAFPFRYAVLEPTSSNTVNLLCLVATIFGILIFMGLMMKDGGKHLDALSSKQIIPVKEVNRENSAAA